MDNDASLDARTLGRIAAVLGIPVEDFFRPSRGPRSEAASSFTEIGALLRVFALLNDPGARARIIATAEAELCKTRWS